MSKLLKWIYKLGEQHAYHDVISELSAMRQYHNMMAENAYLKEKYQPEQGIAAKRDMFYKSPLKPNEHGAIADELGQAIEWLAQRLSETESQDE